MKQVHGRGPLTDADRARIEELAPKGMTAGRIAMIIKRHPSTVQWFMYSTGLKAPAPTPEQAKTYRRGDQVIYRYSAAEDAFIVERRRNGGTLVQIAKEASLRFNTVRTDHGINVRLRMLASREEAAA